METLGDSNMIQICTKCHNGQSLNQFNKARTRKDGTVVLSSWCKICIATYKKEYSTINKEKLKIKKQEYYQNNKEKIIDDNKIRYQNNKEHKKEYDKIRHEEKGDELRAAARQYYYDNKEKYLARNKIYVTNKYQTDPHYKIHNRISSEVRKSLLKEGVSKDGYSILDFL